MCTFTKLLAMFITLAWLVACSPLEDKLKPTKAIDSVSNDDSGSDSIIASYTMEAYDGDDRRIGYVTFVSTDSITVQSNKGYLYNLFWDGSIPEDNFHFTEKDAKGTMFLRWYGVQYGKSVFRLDDVLYTYKDVHRHGFAEPDSSITEYKSYKFGSKITNSSGSVSSDQKAYVLKEITRAEAGIPTTIALPIKIQYQKK